MPRLFSELLPLPYFHIMALAPLDVWLRLLRQTPVAIPPRYWPRLALALLCSFAATLLTLPERVVYALWTRLAPPDPARLAPPLFILGYYRSGTTHLQYMLSRDPQLASPRWFEALAPQGFALSWILLRFFLVPFLPATRFQDAMLFGANSPAEDDFALNNWSLASTLPGRAVVPEAQAFYDRFHDLERLTPEELERWRATLAAFVHKLVTLRRSRHVLLKTPSHTARIPALLRLFPDARFVHISRRPDAVLRSNVALLRLVQERYALQDAGVCPQHLADEYLATEEHYLRDRLLIPSGRLAEVRLEDLLADPIGEVRRVYQQLELSFGPEFEGHLCRYLDATRTYTTNVHDSSADEPRLAELTKRLGHDTPPIAAAALPRSLPERRRIVPALAAALVCTMTWLLAVHLVGHRLDWLIWPTGVAIGLTRRSSGRANTPHGLFALVLAAGVLLIAALGSSWVLQSGSLENVLATTRQAFAVEARIFWSFMGLASAYKLAASDQT